ncbi:MAG: hypothetical protein M3Z84_02550 [Actinomycetota bacterium]|nr:hypothetical protein [Actinomycetota bacterium]
MAERPSGRQLVPGLRISDILNVRDQTDESGRLLLEDSAPKRARKDLVRAGIPMKTAKCSYADSPSRQGGTMNVSAYEALRQDTAEILDGYAWFTSNYLTVFPERRATVRALYDTSHLGLTLPLVLFYRGVDTVAPYKKLPSYVASIFKASRGLFSAALDLLNRRGPYNDRLTAGEVVRFAEYNKHFTRERTGRVCAAPTRLIERSIAVLLTAEGASAENSRLPELVDFPTLLEFFSIEDAFGDALSRYRFILANLMKNAPRARPRELYSYRVPEAGNQTFEELSDSLVRHANTLQSELNRVLRRGDTAPELTIDNVLQLL